MQQEPPSRISSPSRKQYLIRTVVYSLVGVALFGLALYLNSLDSSNIFTTGQKEGHLNAFGCLSGLAFIAGVIILFVPLVLFRSYRLQLVAAQASRTPGEGTQQAGAAAQKSGEVSAFLGGVAGVFGWIIGWPRVNRPKALAGIFTFMGFFGIAQGLMNLNLVVLGAGVVFTLFGLLVRFIANL